LIGLVDILTHTDTIFLAWKLLAVPELVPFRLTRNVVDGMGPCGTEGTFQSAAEETMLTLRNNSRDLLTILSAVVADPLYRWQTDVLEARRRQTEKDDVVETTTSRKTVTGKTDRLGTRETTCASDTKIISKDEKNQAAMKTIEKIKQKLDGYEESTFGDQQGVEGQVQLLINSARDPNLLKRMYVGWAPWI
jgi:serine-protein kinase ATM